MNIYKRWITHSFYIFTLLISSVSLFNYTIDSLGIYGHSSYLNQAAKDLTSGNDIVGISNYDERHFQELLVKNLKTKIDTIAIGSSRTLHLQKNFVTNKNTTFFNHSVRAATLGDYIAIIGLYEEIHGYIPKNIIIGVDPWIFNKGNAEFRYKTLNKYYTHIASKLNEPKEIENKIKTNKYKELINYEYTLSNIKFFYSLVKNDMQAFSIYNGDEKSHHFVKKSYGSGYYIPFSVTPSYQKSVELKALSYTKGDAYSLSRFQKLDYIELFEKFVVYLQNRGTKVTFLLPPYHPISYDLLINNPKYEIIQDVEIYLNAFSKENNIKLYGSYNPNISNLTNKDFIDGMHTFDWALKRILLDYKLNI